jgi:hypothetical protein
VAIHGADGIKQPEQFCHTAWHYNAYFTHRGDFRRGMPVHGRTDSEHGWAQALPLSALLEQGHVTLDWPTGRAAGLPGLEVRVWRHDAGYRVDVTGSGGPSDQPESPLLLRILRPPGRGSIRVASDTTSVVVPWPAVLASVPVRHSGSGSLVLTGH